jgi:hypothetical protein
VDCRQPIAVNCDANAVQLSRAPNFLILESWTVIAIADRIIVDRRSILHEVKAELKLLLIPIAAVSDQLHISPVILFHAERDQLVPTRRVIDR